MHSISFKFHPLKPHDNSVEQPITRPPLLGRWQQISLMNQWSFEPGLSNTEGSQESTEKGTLSAKV